LDGEAEPTGRHTSSRKGARSEVVEVITRGDRRRAWSAEQKRLIVEAMQPGAKAAEVIRRWGISSGLFYDWRRLVLAGELGQVPVPAPAFARAELAEPKNAQPPASAVMSAPPGPEATHPAVPRCSALTRIEVELPCGTVLRVDETVGVEALRRVPPRCAVGDRAVARRARLSRQRRDRHATWHGQPRRARPGGPRRGSVRRVGVRLPRPQGRLVKSLWHDGIGLCLLTKRIEQGAFPWPTTPTGSVQLSPAQMSLLLKGLEWRKVQPPWRPTAV